MLIFHVPVLGDDEHAGRMGVRTEGDKRPVPRVGSRGSRGTASRRCRKRAGDQGDRCCNRPTPLPRARSRWRRLAPKNARRTVKQFTAEGLPDRHSSPTTSRQAGATFGGIDHEHRHSRRHRRTEHRR